MADIKWCIEYLEKYNQEKMDYYFNSFDRFRADMNITMPYFLSNEYYLKQDEVLKEVLSKKTIVSIEDITFKNKLGIYKGDITLLKVDAIVNACNEKLLGCFSPLHSCIDNAIHSFAGLQVRRDLLKVMQNQGHDEPNGKCKVTSGYNLPAKYIFHTVGPKSLGYVTKEEENDLRSCYLSCLSMADKMKLTSIAFPCISTGVYGYPKVEAAAVAYNTVREYLENNPSTSIQYVIFNVFKEDDYATYQGLVK